MHLALEVVEQVASWRLELLSLLPELLDRLTPERRQIVQPLQLIPREPNLKK